MSAKSSAVKGRAGEQTENWGLGMEHEVTAVAHDAKGQVFEMPAVEIVQLSRDPKKGSEVPNLIARNVQFAISLPPNGSGRSTRTHKKKHSVPRGASSVLSDAWGELWVSETDGRQFDVTQDPIVALEYDVDPKSSFEEQHEAAAKRLAAVLCQRARLSKIEAAVGTLSHLFSFCYVVLVACKPGKNTLRLDDEAGLATILADATREYYLPPAPRRRRVGRAPLRRRSQLSGLDVDSGFVEMRSDKYLRATVSSVARELVEREKDVVDLATKVAKGHGLSTPASIMSRGDAVNGKASGLSRHTYAGSFHVWLTLPHKAGPAFDHARFTLDHSRAVTAIQWLEPLLVACMPADPRCPGSGQEFSRASMRSRMNELNGFGVASVSLPQVRPVLCYDSIDALNRDERPRVVRTDAVWLETASGAHINILACYSQDRLGRDTRAVSSLDGAAFSITNDGTDIRFNSCSSGDVANTSADRELIRSGHVAFVRGERGVEVAVATYESVDANGNLVYGPRRCSFDPRGIEVRLFDQMPGRNEEMLLNLVVILAVAGNASSAGKSRKQKHTHPSEDDEWLLAMYDCCYYGSRVPLSKRFVARAAAALGVRAPEDVSLTAYQALNELLRLCHQKYSNNRVARSFGYKGPVVFPDINYPSWLDAVRRRLGTDPALSRKLQELAARAETTERLEEAVQAYLGSGWDPDRYMIEEMIAQGHVPTHFASHV